MKNNILAILALGALTFPALSAEQNPAEAKLRESLRNAMLQARSLQAERDALQAAKTQLEQEKKTAADQAAALQKQLAADKDASDKAIADLHEKETALSGQVVQLKESLEKWKSAHGEVTTMAQKKENERAKLAQEKIELQRVVADQRTKNLSMYRVGTEILSRYEKFGLGTALSAREPFTGAMRVKLENLVQDYSDKLAEQRIKPGVAKAEQGAPDVVKPAGNPSGVAQRGSR